MLTDCCFDVINQNGDYLGGVISPGIKLSLKALHDMTAKLPQIEIKKQQNVIGKTTIEAMNSGVYFGYISLVEGLIRRIKDEYKKEMKVVITGGLASLFKNSINLIDYIDPNLTLEGLNIVYNKNIN